MGKHNNQVVENVTNEESKVVKVIVNEVLDTPVVKDATINMSAITNQLSSALSVDTSEYFTKLDNGSEIIQREYKFINPVGKKDKMVIYDMELIESIEKINASIYGKDILSYVICKELAKINSTDKLKKYNFNSIADYAKAVHGFESSTTNHYVRIGNSFINDDYSIKKGLPKLGISHLIELNSLVDEKGNVDSIIQLYVDGTLTDGMSTKVVREVVKSLKNGTTIEDKSSATETPVSDNTSTKVESPDNSLPIVNEVETLDKSFDNKVASAQILGHCNSIEAIVEVMARNDIFTETIVKSLKQLIVDTKQML